MKPSPLQVKRIAELGKMDAWQQLRLFQGCDDRLGHITQVCTAELPPPLFGVTALSRALAPTLSFKLSLSTSLGTASGEVAGFTAILAIAFWAHSL